MLQGSALLLAAEKQPFISSAEQCQPACDTGGDLPAMGQALPPRQPYISQLGRNGSAPFSGPAPEVLPGTSEPFLIKQQ